MSRVRKLLFGHQQTAHSSRSALKSQLFVLLRIWRNYTHTDFGIERIIRLTLASLQFLSISLYLKQIFGRFGVQSSKMIIEGYVLLKMLLPLWLMTSGHFRESWSIGIIVYSMIETVVYLNSLIFLSDASRDTVSPKRSLILLFINFFEGIFDFALIYFHYDVLNSGVFTVHFADAIDAIYFSFVTAGTVGYGDITPVAPMAKTLAMMQISLTFVFVALFLNYFISLLQKTGHTVTSARYRKTRHSKAKRGE